MGVSVFGHGDLSDHDPANGKSHGPDPFSRGPCCAGKWQPCYDREGTTCHDHCCCCDPCRHTRTDICRKGCCKCVPRWICATFTPDTPSTECKVRSRLMEANTDGDRVVYAGNLPGIGPINVSVGPPGVGSPLNGYHHCSWQMVLEDLYVDEEEPVDHSGEINCQTMPAFSVSDISVTVQPPIGEPVECVGTLTFESFVLRKIPFVHRFPGGVSNVATTCGYCTEVCSTLAVVTGTATTQSACREFTWNAESEQWEYSEDDYGYDLQVIELVEVEGECYLRPTVIVPDTFEGDLIKIDSDNCNLGMNLTATDEDGRFIRISCNPCHCWEYKCNSCRCLCERLCVSGVIGGTAIEPGIAIWDNDYEHWVLDDLIIELGKNDENGKCTLTIAGFDPVDVDGLCSKDFALTIGNEDGDFYALSCETCEGSCGSGTCLEYCDDVPAILFADVTPTDWDEALCPGLAFGCFEPIRIGLAQFFVGGGVVAGEYRWQGSGIIECRNCNPTVTAPSEYIVAIDLGCDGTGFFSVRKRNPAPGDPDATGVQFAINFVLPCGPEAIWDLAFEFDNANGLQGCCDEAGWLLEISE